MKTTTKIVYTFDGKDFPSVEKVQDHASTKIMALLGNWAQTGDVKYRAQVALVELLIDNRDAFRELLEAFDPIEQEEKD